MINLKQRNFLLVISVAFLVSFLTNNAIVTVVAVYILSSIIWSVFFKKKEFTGVMLWTIIILGIHIILFQIFT